MAGMSDSDETVALSFDTADYRHETRARSPLRIGEHTFALINHVDSYEALVERDLPIESFIAESDRDRFLETWANANDPDHEEPEWPLPMMTKIAADLGKSYAPKDKRNRKARRRR